MYRVRLHPALAALALLAACQEGAVAPPPPDTAGPPQAVRPEGYPGLAETRTGWIAGRDGDPVQVTYEVRGDLAIFEGDIVLGRIGEIARTREELLSPEGLRRGVVIDGSARRWTGGVVPYVIDASLPSQYRVTDAIAHIEATTVGVDFVPRTTQTDYIRVVPSSGCSSAVGRQGGRQDLNLASGCSTGSTIHEFLHALGMHHEQNRCDRDGFVTIHWENVTSGTEHNFQKQCTGYTDVHLYDEGSIMHYGPYAFSRNGLKTISSKRAMEYLMGQRSGMSSTDVNTVDWMYPTTPTPPPPPLAVSISGPWSVTSKSTYSWQANATGGTGSYTYQWQVRWVATGYTQSGSTTKTQTLVMGPWDGDVELTVTVTSGSSTKTATRYVTTGTEPLF